MTVPLRLRLTLAFALAMALVLSGLGGFLYWRLGRDLMASVDFGLRSRAQGLLAGLQEGSTAVTGGGGLIDPDESFAQVLDASGRVIGPVRTPPDPPLVSPADLATVSGPTFFVKDIPRIDVDPVRLLAVSTTVGDRQVYAVLGATLGDRKDALYRLLVALGIGGPVALALACTAGWKLAGAALRPVERMRREAAAISVSEPDRRLPVPHTGDELARLGATLNTMLDRLQQSFERERRFVDDASHELRTPLSILKMELDLALSRARTPEELETALRNASAETDRLVGLAQDLLVLARADRGALPIQREDVSLPDLVASVCVAHQARADRAGVAIRQDVTAGQASIDPARVRQALENLLDNAIRHTPPGGSITIRASRGSGRVDLVVEDSGPGFSSSVRGHEFEPFVRMDQQAHADGGGAGLGLAIVRAVAEAHGGTAQAADRPGGGARLTLTFRE